MKTTVELSNAVMEQARKIASRERTTVRALVEEGLRRVIAERSRSRGFQLRDGSFEGRGLRQELAGTGWDRIRDLAYEGRGG